MTEALKENRSADLMFYSNLSLLPDKPINTDIIHSNPQSVRYIKVLLFIYVCGIWLFPAKLSGQSYFFSGQGYEFTTVAGFPGPSGGHLDGTGPTARFSSPDAVAFDSAGILYVADGNSIRKITPSGTVTTFVGGNYGSADGTGTAAQFSSTTYLAIDSADNIIVADSGNFTVRKVTQAGVVTTLAGKAGNDAYVDATGSAARFRGLGGIGVDAVGNVYVSDIGNNAVREITPSGVVTTLAGGTYGSANGTGSAAQFAIPRGVAVALSGNIYVADWSNNEIRKVTPAGVVTTLAGSTLNGAADGTGASARFYYPCGVTTDLSENVYVSDTYNNTIRKITPAGVVTTIAGPGARIQGGYGSSTSADGVGAAAEFFDPKGIAVDSSGNLFVADSSNFTIRKITPVGVVTTFAGPPGSRGSTDGAATVARFNGPGGLRVDSSGNIYVADPWNGTVRKITPTGVVTTLAGLAGAFGSTDGVGAAARFAHPVAVAVDSSGNVYVAEFSGCTIRKISPAGVVTTFAGKVGEAGSADGEGTKARFNGPNGIDLDSQGNIYVSDLLSHTIRKISPSGIVTTMAGLAGAKGSSDGVGNAARFNEPQGLTVDNAGNIYVADYGNSTIRKISPAGLVTTLAGQAGIQGYNDGIGAAARFSPPYDVAVDATGNVYVAAYFDKKIRKISPGGVVTTFAGTGSEDSKDGPASVAQFRAPSNVAVDAFGNIYVSDYGNNTIRKAVLVAIAPTITIQPASQSVIAGNAVTFSALAGGSPAPTLQWQRLPAGSGIWGGLSEGGNYSGTTTTTLTISNTTAGMAGDQFRCVATNSAGSAISDIAVISFIVAPSSAVVTITVE